MVKNIHLEELTELHMDDNGIITYECKMIQARPMGRAFPVIVKIMSKQDKELSSRRLLEYNLEHNYVFPDNADAYVWSDTVFNLVNVEIISAIQPYKLMEEKIK